MKIIDRIANAYLSSDGTLAMVSVLLGFLLILFLILGPPIAFDVAREIVEKGGQTPYE